MARRFRLLPHEAEDLVGEVRLELTKTVKLADMSRDINFIAYAFPSVKGAAFDTLARQRKHAVFARVARVVRGDLFPHSNDEEDEEDQRIDLSLAPSEPRSATVEHLREQAAQIAGAVVLSLTHAQGDDEMVERLDQLGREAHLRETFAALAPKERKVAEMRHFEGKTLAEIAKAIGDSTRTVQRIEKTVAKKLGLRIVGAGMRRRRA